MSKSNVALAVLSVAAVALSTYNDVQRLRRLNRRDRLIMAIYSTPASDMITLLRLKAELDALDHPVSQVVRIRRFCGVRITTRFSY